MVIESIYTASDWRSFPAVSNTSIYSMAQITPRLMEERRANNALNTKIGPNNSIKEMLRSKKRHNSDDPPETPNSGINLKSGSHR